jgi:hypothetical protein
MTPRPELSLVVPCKKTPQDDDGNSPLMVFKGTRIQEMKVVKSLQLA